MNLRFHNHLSRQTDDFQPQEIGKVTLYTCGPTVYASPTIGNWVSYIYWDTLVRILQAHDLDVTRVMNITDVGHLVSDADDGEDKLEKGARSEGKTAWEVALDYTNEFMDGMKALNLIQPTHMPKATDYISQQLDFVRELKQKGHTYQISDGIYFDTSTFPRYADFANLDLEALQAGARVEFNTEKRHASDFALWKFSPSDSTRDMQWETPSDITDDGATPQGFPGWHLECSTMARSLLGDTLDIHTGGIDHIPVHHTNEIAQSESVTGKPLSRFWIHNNHLKVNGTKISKSLGNGYILADLTEKGYSPLDFRLFVLQSHYRSEGNFTFENLDAAKQRRLNWRNAAALRHQIHDTLTEHQTSDKTVSLYAASGALREAISDDLNTAKAMAIIDEAFTQLATKRLDDINRHALIGFIETIDDLLGLKLLDTTPDITDSQKKQIIERRNARENGDYATSDMLRNELLKNGVALRDTPSGAIWEYSL